MMDERSTEPNDPLSEAHAVDIPVVDLIPGSSARSRARGLPSRAPVSLPARRPSPDSPSSSAVAGSIAVRLRWLASMTVGVPSRSFQRVTICASSVSPTRSEGGGEAGAPAALDRFDGGLAGRQWQQTDDLAEVAPQFVAEVLGRRSISPATMAAHMASARVLTSCSSIGPP